MHFPAHGRDSWCPAGELPLGIFRALSSKFHYDNRKQTPLYGPDTDSHLVLFGGLGRHLLAHVRSGQNALCVQLGRAPLAASGPLVDLLQAVRALHLRCLGLHQHQITQPNGFRASLMSSLLDMHALGCTNIRSLSEVILGPASYTLCWTCTPWGAQTSHPLAE